MDESNCVFCDGLLQEVRSDVDACCRCETCGKYKHRPEFPELYRQLPDRHLFSGYIREQNEVYNRTPNFPYPDECEEVIEQAPRRIPDKAAKLLKAVERRTKHFGQVVLLTIERDYPLAYCMNAVEFRALLEYCGERGWLTLGLTNVEGQISSVKLTADGFAELEARANANLESDKAFVAMRFSDQMKAIYDDAIDPAIRACGFQPMRIDQHEKIGDVVDLMLAEIRESRFIVADFTERNEGVYFETGFAMGLSLPVISSCRKDWIRPMHFDTNHFSHIVWETADELKKGLVARIRANIGQGPLKPKQ